MSIKISADEREKIFSRSPACVLLEQTLKNPPADLLRAERTSTWLECACEAILNLNSAQVVSYKWSQFTDHFLAKTWTAMNLSDYGLCLFALGKLGASELNLSSDIDLLVVSSKPATNEALKKFREWVSTISKPQPEGPGYRVDLDLRPGGRFGPLIPSLSELEDYYWLRGATWERLALVRARAIVGDSSTRLAAQLIFSKFTYRKFLDFRLLQDLKSLRAQIQEQQIAKDKSINLKFHPGGIRDIELFINSLQVIHGGKDSDLQVNQTSLAFKAIKDKNLLPLEQVEFLENLYWFLRGLENYAQALHDKQTHLWQESLGAFELNKALSQTAQAHGIVSELLGKPLASSSLPREEGAQIEWLNSLGILSEAEHSTWKDVFKLTALSTQSADDETRRQAVLKKFVEHLPGGIDLRLGLLNLYDFIKATRAKAGFFTLLLHEPRLINDLAILFSTSPYLGGILSARPELLDSFVLKSDSDYSNDIETFLSEATDRRLLTELVCAAQFLNSKKLEPVCEALTQNADLAANKLLAILSAPTPRAQITLLPLGKWGTRELGFRSDLDFIYITQKIPSDIEHKICRRFLNHITESRKGGSLFSVDLRLRPTGSAGPMLITEEKLIDYLENEAQAWERQSYLRARTDSKIGKRIHKTIIERGFSDSELLELKKIRCQLYKKAPTAIDLKYAPGGLIDIEFAAQIATIYNGLSPETGDTVSLISALQKNVPAWRSAADYLLQKYKELRLIEQLMQIVAQRATSVLHSQDEATTRVSRLLKIDAVTLFGALNAECVETHKILKSLDPIWQKT